jgi:hypothetical protein
MLFLLPVPAAELLRWRPRLPGNDHERARLTGTCAKIRYRTLLDARIALALMPDVRGNGTGKPGLQQRAYRCPACRGYHLTSLPKRGKRR